jgi:hypothetical protein
MQTNRLLEIISTPLPKRKVEKLASEVKFAVKELIDLTFHHHPQIGFRAAWILENVCVNHQERFLPFVVYFLERFDQQKNLSAQRHYAKILAMLTNIKSSPEIKSILATFDHNKVIETAFNWLIDERTPVAIKSHCLNILANLSAAHLWVKEELLQTIDFLIDIESIGFYAKAKQIRKQLAEQSRKPEVRRILPSN